MELKAVLRERRDHIHEKLLPDWKDLFRGMTARFEIGDAPVASTGAEMLELLPKIGIRIGSRMNRMEVKEHIKSY